MEYVSTFALKLLALAGIGNIGLTAWIGIVVGVAVTAGLLGRLWDRRARKEVGGGRTDDELSK